MSLYYALRHKRRAIIIGFSIIVALFIPLIFLQSRIEIYLFVVVLTALLYARLTNLNSTFSYSFPKKALDILVIAISSIVLTSVAIYGVSDFLSPLVFIEFLFVPGWSILRCTLTGSKLGITESVILGILLSVGLSCLIYLGYLAFANSLNPLIPFLTIFLISLTPFFVYKIKLRKTHPIDRINEYFEGKINVFDVAILLTLMIFYIFVISILYPQMAFVPGHDIVRHYSALKGLIQYPELFGSEYPWYHFILSFLLSVTGLPMHIFQTMVAYLSILLIFSFHILSRRLLVDIDGRAPIIATVIFSTFSGFGWIYVVPQLSFGEDLDEIILEAFGPTYWDIGQGGNTWFLFWFRPITLGLGLFLALLYLLTKSDLEKSKYIFLATFLVITLSQIHFPELLLFSLFLLVTSIVFPKSKFKIIDMSFSVILGSVVSILLTMSYGILFSPDFRPALNEYQAVCIIISGTAIILVKCNRRPKLNPKIKMIVPTVAWGFSLLYLFFLFLWLSSSPDLSIPEIVISDYSVPIQFYPVLLGITGFLGIIGLGMTIREYSFSPITVFALMFVLFFVAGKSITLINDSVWHTDYWERRLIPLVFLCGCLLAPIVILRMLSAGPRILQQFSSPVIISTIILVGTISTVWSIEYQQNIVPLARLNDDEEGLLMKLSRTDPTSNLVTVTDRSRTIAFYHNIGYIVNHFRPQIWQSVSPEFPIDVLSSINGTSTVYLNDADQLILQSDDYLFGYLGSHLVRSSNPGASGTGIVQIVNLVSPVSTDSSIALVINGSDPRAAYFSYDLLSSGGYNYTSILVDDISALSSYDILLSPSLDISQSILELSKKYSLDIKKIITLDMDGVKETDTVPDRLGLGKWDVSGIGRGNVSAPTIETSNLNSVTFKVDQGRYKYWQVSNMLSDSLNLSNFTFANIRWHGHGDGKSYNIELVSDSGIHWYRFFDIDKGLTELRVPLNVPNGIYNYQGVHFLKESYGRPGWTQIDEIRLRPSLSNINQNGTFRLGPITFPAISPVYSIIWESGNNLILDNPGIIESDYLPETMSGRVIAYYSNKTIPAVIYEVVDEVDHFFVNLYPIKNRLITNSSAASAIFNQLNLSLPLYKGEDRSYYQFFDRARTSVDKASGMAFEKLSIEGNLLASSASGWIDVLNAKPIVVASDKNDTEIIENVKRLNFLDNTNITLLSNDSALSNGIGLYSKIIFNSSDVHKKNTQNSTRILVEYFNGSQSVIIYNNPVFHLPKGEAMLRNPMISAQGNFSFKNMYTFGDLTNRLKSLGQDLYFEGDINFHTKYSDQFTIADNIRNNITYFSADLFYSLFGDLDENFFTLHTARILFPLILVYLVIQFYLLDPHKRKETSNKLLDEQ